MAFQKFDYRCITLAGLLVSLLAASGCSVKTTSKDSPPKTSDSAVAAGGTVTPAANAEKATETINIEGSSTVYPICQQFAVEFEKITKHKISAEPEWNRRRV